MCRYKRAKVTWQSTSAMRINEIFYSLQGEGFHTGTPAVFVRFSGCNLRCSFCDTDFEQFVEMSEDEIVAAVRQEADGMGAFVVLTGGEPSLQVTASLVQKLHEDGCYVAMETNGTHQVAAGVDWITCSPKEGSRLQLGEASELKVVYCGQNVETWREKVHAPHNFLQPCSGENIPETVDYIKSHPWWRLSLQTHKLIHIP